MENPTIDPSDGELKDKSINDLPLTEGADNQEEAKQVIESVDSDETVEPSPSEPIQSSTAVDAKTDETANVTAETTVKDEENPEESTPETPTATDEFDKEVLIKYSAEELVDAFKKISEISDWMFKNSEIQLIKDLFDEKFHHKMTEVKTTFLEEGGNEIDFVFKPKYKEQFDHLSYEYRQRKRKHYKDLEATQKANLEKRQNIIEEIKQLITVDENINTVYKRFRALQDSWHNSGSVPRAQSQNIWQTYKHHVERFYDFLHLNRDLRDLDFKHNYEEKLKIIEQAETLIDLPDIMKANRDLNTLHRLWKNDLGPVAHKHREDLWNRFQSATKIIHKKRSDYQKNIEVVFSENLKKKKAILTEMEGFVTKLPANHKEWQNTLTRFNELRDEFKTIGHVTSNESKATWKSFRELGRTFTHEKNVFYKNQKTEHKQNIDQKKALISELEQILESDNWSSRSNEVKGFQTRWKKVGFIPRKIDNQLWNDFRNKNNLFFERIKSGYQKMSSQEESIYNEKLGFIESLKEKEFPTDSETFISFIKTNWTEWQSMGKLNDGLSDKINSILLKTIVACIKKLEISKKEQDHLIFESKLIIKQNDSDSIQDEIQQLRTKISTIKGEINQLENNLEFFSNSSSDNPLFKEVQTKISRLIKNMGHLDSRMIRLKQLKNALKKQAQDSEVAPSEEE